MQLVHDVEAEMHPPRGLPRRAARATQMARLWALAESDELEREALRLRLVGLEIGEPPPEADPPDAADSLRR